MKTKNKLSAAVLNDNKLKRKFSLWELYRSLVFAPRAVSKLKKNAKTRLVDRQFIERLQLAVTEVNGCAACSYQHTQMALQEGMSNEEISSFLSGADNYIKPEEAKGIMFAQHFADSRGKPKKDTYKSVIEEYGEDKAEIILAAAQTMIAGNMYGIPYSAFLSRRQGKPYEGSNVFYELTMLIFGVLLLPIAIINAYLRALVGLPNKRFDKKK